MTSPRALIAGAVVLLSLLAPATAGAQTATCTPDAAWAVMKPAFADEVLTLTNSHRLGLGLTPLAASDTLEGAAEWKAAHMAYFGYFSHDDQSPTRSWDQRIRDCGYSYGAGENIAYGYRTPLEVVTGWLNSSGHRANIENPNYRVLGVGAAVDDSGRTYWVQNFGTKAEAGDQLPTPEPTATTPPEPEETGGTPPAQVPVAAADSVTVPEDGSVRLDPTANDLVGEGDVLEIVYHEDPVHGTVTRTADGHLVYRPDPNFAGTDGFHYWISDQFDRTCGARITVTVEPANDAPVPRVDRVRVRPGTRVFVSVVDNDVDVDGDRLSFEGIATGPSFGSATAEPDTGVVSYRARRGTSGRDDVISYVVNDGNGGTATGRLRISIRR